MPLKYPAKSAAGDFTPVPAGTHIAICDIVADIGVQPGSGMYLKPKRQVFIRFEFPNERIDYEKDGKKLNGPAVLGKTYTASMNEKANLRHDLGSWRGMAFTDEEAEQFDVSAILGKACMVSITHTQKGEKTYANITSLGKLMKGINANTLIPEIAAIYYGPDNESSYKLLPEWLQKKIDGQIIEETAQAQTTTAPSPDDFQITDDDIPF